MRSKKLRYIALALAVITTLLAFASCTVEKSYYGAPEGMRPCNQGEMGVILYVPSNWSVDNSTGIPTAFFSNTEKSMITLIKADRAGVDAAVQNEGESKAEAYWRTQKDALMQHSGFEMIANPVKPVEYYSTSIIAETRQLFEYRYSITVSQGETAVKYCISQSFIFDAASGDLFMLTYSALESYFEAHTEDLYKVHANLRFTSEIVPMEDSTPAAEFTEYENTPAGFKALTGDHVEYVLFVPETWVPSVNTGLTAASSPIKSTTTVNVTGFNAKNSGSTFTAADHDSYFEAHKKTLIDAFGNFTYADEANPYTEQKFYTTGSTVPLSESGRRYVYNITFNGVTYTYEQYIVYFAGYVYQITFCSTAADYTEASVEFKAIVDNFRFKL